MAHSNKCPELCEELIQPIQSFLEYKEAARSSLVAKSWYTSWCIRPNLYFRSGDFDVLGTGTPFWNYVTKTVQRSIHHKVKVDKLSLIMPFTFHHSHLLHKLLVDILELRVNVLDIYFLDINDMDDSYVMPAQVFANSYLTVLSLDNCKVGNLDSRYVLCQNLTTLKLIDVPIDDKSFKDILVGSPIIESLTLSGELTRGFETIDARDLCNLKTLMVDEILLDSPGITSSFFSGRFLNLSSMVLKDVYVDYSFFANLSSTFPYLEDLYLKRLRYDENIRWSSLIISSSSLKRLRLKHSYLHGRWNMANFDVPNIEKFTFSGDHAPAISFTATSEEWESEIKLTRFDEIMIRSDLRDLLRKLGQSKISLRFTIYLDRVDVPRRNVFCLPFEDSRLPAVEELMYYDLSHAGCNFFIECVLNFRPKLVHFACNFDAFGTLPILVMYELFTGQKKDSPGATIYGLPLYLTMKDLPDEVGVECLEDSLKQWQPLKCSLDALEIQNYKAEQLRLKLGWESEETIINFIDNR